MRQAMTFRNSSVQILSDPTHPVSIAIKKMQDIPEIKIIEGRPK